LTGASPPASSALFDEKHPRKSIRFFNHEAVLQSFVIIHLPFSVFMCSPREKRQCRFLYL